MECLADKDKKGFSMTSSKSRKLLVMTTTTSHTYKEAEQNHVPWELPPAK